MTTSLITQRVLFNLTDISVAVSDYKIGSYAIISTAGDYLYVGASCPFNNIWVNLSTASLTPAGSPVVEVWYNGAWNQVVDVIDQTEQMTVSGRLSWALDLDKGWSCEQRSETVGLTGTAIYNRYWLRISWPDDFTAGISYVGQKFSDDSAMAGLYPDLLQPAILSGFKTGKTTWDEQHFMAAEAIIKEIRKRNFAADRGQLMDWTVFEDAACHKVADIVYSAFGAPYREHAAEARKRYNEEINARCLVIDSNADGHLSPAEAQDRQGWLTR